MHRTMKNHRKHMERYYAKHPKPQKAKRVYTMRQVAPLAPVVKARKRPLFSFFKRVVGRTS